MPGRACLAVALHWEAPCLQPAETCFQPAHSGWEGEKEASKVPASMAAFLLQGWWQDCSCTAQEGFFPHPTAPGLSCRSLLQQLCTSLLCGQWFVVVFFSSPSFPSLSQILAVPAQLWLLALSIYFLSWGRKSTTRAAAAKVVSM